MRSIHFLAVLIVLAMCSCLARAEYDSAGGASIAKSADSQANKQVQPNTSELAVARFVGVAAIWKAVNLKIIIRPIGPIPAMKPAKKPMQIKKPFPNPPGR